MDAVADQFRRCKVCGDVVAADRSRARGGMTAKHHITMELSDTKPLCKGSKIRFDAQPDRSEPWAPPSARPIPKTWASMGVASSSPRNKHLERLRGRGTLTRVDFREARTQRALGHVRERGDALRFVRMEVRDA